MHHQSYPEIKLLSLKYQINIKLPSCCLNAFVASKRSIKNAINEALTEVFAKTCPNFIKTDCTKKLLLK